MKRFIEIVVMFAITWLSISPSSRAQTSDELEGLSKFWSHSCNFGCILGTEHSWVPIILYKRVWEDGYRECFPLVDGSEGGFDGERGYMSRDMGWADRQTCEDFVVDVFLRAALRNIGMAGTDETLRWAKEWLRATLGSSDLPPCEYGQHSVDVYNRDWCHKATVTISGHEDPPYHLRYFKHHATPRDCDVIRLADHSDAADLRVTRGYTVRATSGANEASLQNTVDRLCIEEALGLFRKGARLIESTPLWYYNVPAGLHGWDIDEKFDDLVNGSTQRSWKRLGGALVSVGLVIFAYVYHRLTKSDSPRGPNGSDGSSDEQQLLDAVEQYYHLPTPVVPDRGGTPGPTKEPAKQPPFVATALDAGASLMNYGPLQVAVARDVPVCSNAPHRKECLGSSETGTLHTVVYGGETITLAQWNHSLSSDLPGGVTRYYFHLTRSTPTGAEPIRILGGQRVTADNANAAIYLAAVALKLAFARNPSSWLTFVPVL